MIRREFLPLKAVRVEPRRGAGLRALACITMGWLAMRAFFIIGDDGEVRLRPFPALAQHRPQPDTRDRVPLAPSLAQWKEGRTSLFAGAPFLGALDGRTRHAFPSASRAGKGTGERASSLEIDRDYMGQLGPLFLFGGDAPMPTAGMSDRIPNFAAAVPFDGGFTPALAPRTGAGQAGGLGLFAYVFWRPDAGANAPYTSYGGSQWFARADYRFGGTGISGRSSVYARASGAMTADRRTEFALGGAVQPFAGVPVSVHAERRFRSSAPDATAAFVSGGVTDVALPYGTSLDAYAQGGGLWPDKGDALVFFDGQATAKAPLFRADKRHAEAGIMLTAGGQGGPRSKDIARLDVGPVLIMGAKHDTTQVEGQIGWRFRIAGDSAPEHGPAITLQVGF